jgi:hypothetical protein
MNIEVHKCGQSYHQKKWVKWSLLRSGRSTSPHHRSSGTVHAGVGWANAGEWRVDPFWIIECRSSVSDFLAFIFEPRTQRQCGMEAVEKSSQNRPPRSKEWKEPCIAAIEQHSDRACPSTRVSDGELDEKGGIWFVETETISRDKDELRDPHVSL